MIPSRLNRAATVLKSQAHALYFSCTYDGVWDNEEVEREYHELLALARELRQHARALRSSRSSQDIPHAP